MGRSYDYLKIVERWGKPLFRFKPEISETMYSDIENEEIPEEVMVVSIADRKACGVMTFAKFGEKWYVNEGERFTIRHLLQLTGDFK